MKSRINIIFTRKITISAVIFGCFAFCAWLISINLFSNADVISKTSLTIHKQFFEINIPNTINQQRITQIHQQINDDINALTVRPHTPLYDTFQNVQDSFHQLFPITETSLLQYRQELHQLANILLTQNKRLSIERKTQLITALFILLLIALLCSYLSVSSANTKSAAEEHDLAVCLESKKMATTGKMMSGFIHDLNNFMLIIQGNMRLLSDELDDLPLDPQDTFLSETILDVNSSIDDTIKLSRFMQRFSINAQTKRKVVDLSTFIDESANLLRIAISKNIDIRYDLDYETAPVEVDIHELLHALVNLLLNSKEAFLQDGKITIQTFQLSRKSKTNFAGTPLPKGSFSAITIEDNGKGIPSIVKNEIFTPFFTTKKDKYNNGLGLNIVANFIHNHGGDIVINERNSGTSISLLLPIALNYTETQDKETQHIVRPARPESLEQHNLSENDKCFLVVDNNASLLDYTCSTLTDLGFDSRTLADDKEVPAVFSENDTPIRFVICGPESNMLSWLHQNEHTYHVIITAYEPIPNLMPSEYFLKKPYTKKDLSLLIDTILESS